MKKNESRSGFTAEDILSFVTEVMAPAYGVTIDNETQAELLLIFHRVLKAEGKNESKKG